MEGRKYTMGAKRPPRPVLQIKGPETVTQLACDMQDILTMSEPITPSSSSFSPGSSPPLPGSAVYALQSKVKALSQKKAVERERDDLPQETKMPLRQRKRDEASFSSPMHHPELDMPGSSDEEGMDHVQRGIFAAESLFLGERRNLTAADSEGGQESPFISVAGQTRGLGEGASLESLLTDGAGGLQEDALTARTSLAVSPSPSSSPSSSRPWAPPKGFWRVARPETLILDGENAETPSAGADGTPIKLKMKVGGVDLDSYGELHHSDSLESHLRRCWRNEASRAESFEGLWRADSLDSVCPPEATPILSERMDRNQRVLRQMQTVRRHHAKEATAVDLDCQEDDVRSTESTGMFNEGENDLVYTVSPYEFEQIYRCIVTSNDLPLSPRHEQAKRLLERARLKARSQLTKGEQTVRSCPPKVPDLVSGSSPLHKSVQVAQERANSRDPEIQSANLQHKAVQVASLEEPCRDVPSGSPPLHKVVTMTAQEEIRREVPSGSPPLLKPVLVAPPEETCRDQPSASPSLHKAVIVAAQEEICRDLPTASPPLHKAVLVAAQEEIAIAPIKLVDARGRECERGTRSRRVGQSPTRVRFEDESEKEAERRYLERVRQRGPVVTDKSQNAAAVKSEQSRGISTSSTRKEDEGTATQAIIPQEEVVGKCDACGSLLGIIIAKDRHGQPVLSTADGRGTFVPTWVSSGLVDQPQGYAAENTDLAGVAALADSVGGAGAGEGGAGEQVSGFGKLRRRSLKGERRDDAGHVLGPYARSQDLWAQRRNSYSKMRASMEDGSLLYAQRGSLLPQGVTFSVDLQSALGHSMAVPGTTGILKDTSSPQLPLKSALKSSSKNQTSGQRVLTLMPSVQYRLVHLDQDKEGKPHHIELSADEQLMVTAGTSSTGLTPCIKQSSLRYTTAKMTSDLPSQGLWEPTSETGGEDPTGACAQVGSLECRQALRCGGGTKADDLRSELLRAEHRKAELMWEDMPESARRAMMEQEGKSKLSLRRFFSAMGLNSVGKMVKGNRSSSMDHLCAPSARHIAPAPISASASASPTPTHRPPTRLQRTPSLQSLHTESPLAQLRKVSSVQSLQSPKRLKERSTILGAVPYNLTPREFDQDPCLGDPEVPRGPQGRLVQAYPDGTLQLELSRPANGPFGFVISRGKGRPGSGVFVDHVGDSSAESIYTGLLGVGDEILEVNGEMVAGLSLDQVTRLMTRESTATIRIIPHRWIQS